MWARLSKAILLLHMESTGVTQCLLCPGGSDNTPMPCALVSELETLSAAGSISPPWSLHDSLCGLQGRVVELLSWRLWAPRESFLRVKKQRLPVSYSLSLETGSVMSTISIDQAVTDISQFQGRRHEPHFLMGEVARICLHRIVKLGEWGLGKSTTSAQSP